MPGIVIDVSLVQLFRAHRGQIVVVFFSLVTFFITLMSLVFLCMYSRKQVFLMEALAFENPSTR